MSNKTLIIILAVLVVVVVLAAGFYAISPNGFKNVISKLKETGKSINLISEKPKVVEEKLVIPETQKITGAEGKVVNEGSVAVPLVPENESEKVIVSKAVLTVKGSYDLANPEAQKWSSDAKLVFIKSLGAITLEGKSSQWQLAFSSASAKATADKSKTKQKGYEIIIQADQIVSKKEIESTAVGADLPKNWKDSDEAIKTLQEMPQYNNVSISAINFFYNTDAKEWRYGFSTSIGSVSVKLQ